MSITTYNLFKIFLKENTYMMYEYEWKQVNKGSNYISNSGKNIKYIYMDKFYRKLGWYLWKNQQNLTKKNERENLNEWKRHYFPECKKLIL